MSLFSSPSKRREILKSASAKRTFVPRLEALESRDLLSATFTVINTLSDPSTSGSLPWAVQQANSTPGPNTIDFNIPGSGMQTINISSNLTLTNPVLIDGTSQPGYNGTPLISVQGNASVQNLFVLDSGSSGSTIQGLDLTNYIGNAVELTVGTSGNFIQNNWIGFFRDPTTGQITLNYNLGTDFSGANGIFSYASTTVIRNNVIDGTNNGIVDVGYSGSNGALTPSVNNSITANFIGTDPTGTTAAGYGNEGSGIVLGEGCRTTLVVGNVLSGNLNYGVLMQDGPIGSSSSVPGYNIVEDNKIGTDVSGRYAIPNGTGVAIFGAAAADSINGNLISGNRNFGIDLGIYVRFAGSEPGNSNWIQLNIIGLNASQTAVISNGSYGIYLSNGSTGNHVLGNVIAGASQAGVVLSNASTNFVNENWIGESATGKGFPNGYYGVDLLAGSNNNYIAQNSFGPNGVGSVYVDPNAVGNYIGYTPQPTPSSLSAQVQKIFLYYVQMAQDLATGNVNDFFQSVQNAVSLYMIVELEILNSLLRI